MGKVRARHVWDAVVVVSTTLAALTVPIALIPGWSTIPLIAVAEWLVTVVFAADVLVRIHRLKHGRERDTMLQVVAFDVIPALPAFLVFGHPLILLLRLGKLVRLGQFARSLLRSAVRRAAALRLAFFIYGLFLSAHWITCGWIALRGQTVAAEASWTSYVNALYWCVTTLTTVGYGDVTPVNDQQTLYAIVVMILGVGVYAYIIGNIATILTNIDPARSRYLNAIDRLGAFVRYRQVPPHLQHRIREYYDYEWEKRLGYDESNILDSLPRGLRDEVALFLKRDLLERVDLFADAPEHFTREVALRMKSEIYTPGAYIVRAGETGRDMFFISRGSVRVLGRDNTEVAVLNEGDFFGEIALLEDQPRTASVVAADYCDVYRLTRATFSDVVAQHANIAGQIQEKARQRAREIRERDRDYGSGDTDQP